MAFIMENAGGLGTDGKVAILDIQPTSFHQRCPTFLGSKEDVEELVTYLKKFDE